MTKKLPGDFQVDPAQLKEWLNKNKSLQPGERSGWDGLGQMSMPGSSGEFDGMSFDQLMQNPPRPVTVDTGNTLPAMPPAGVQALPGTVQMVQDNKLAPDGLSAGLNQPMTFSAVLTKLSQTGGSRGGGTGPALSRLPPSSAPAISPTPMPEDTVTPQIKAQQDTAKKAQDEALKKALHSKDLTDEEKVAMVLLAVLPTAIGAIAGGAAGGGLGALSGAAGGLAGTAQSMGAIGAMKEEERKRLLAEAEKMGDRVAKGDEALLNRAGQRESQQISLTESATERAARAAELDKKIKAEDRQQLRQLQNALQIARENRNAALEAELLTQKAKAEGSPKNLTEAQSRAVKFGGRMIANLPDLAKTDHLAASIVSRAKGMTEGDLFNAVKSPEEQMYLQAMRDYLLAFARDDSGAAIGENEWPRYLQTNFPLLNDSPAVIAQKRNKRAYQAEVMYHLAGPGKTIIDEALQNNYGTTAQDIFNSSRSSNRSRGGFDDYAATKAKGQAAAVTDPNAILSTAGYKNSPNRK